MAVYPCRNPDCSNTVSEHMTSGFCFTCQAELAHGWNELEHDLDKVMHLAAQFDAWCRDHNQPDPHQ